MRRSFLIVCLATGLFSPVTGQTGQTGQTCGQSWQLGFLSDPCAGGYPLSFNGGSSTLRYGLSFTCTFPVTGGPGAYLIQLDFFEPIATGPRQRTMNVSVDDHPLLQNFDPYASGASPTSPVSRGFIVISPTGNLSISITGVIGSARLSTVSVCKIRLIPEGPA